MGISLQPIMFLVLFTYVFGGAIAHGNTHTNLQVRTPDLRRLRPAGGARVPAFRSVSTIRRNSSTRAVPLRSATCYPPRPLLSLPRASCVRRGACSGFSCGTSGRSGSCRSGRLAVTGWVNPERPAPVQVHVGGSNEWHELAEWPPQDHRQAWYLNGDGNCAPRLPPAPGHRRCAMTPRTPLPRWAASCCPRKPDRTRRPARTRRDATRQARHARR